MCNSFEKTPLPPLPEGLSLRAWRQNATSKKPELFFESDGKWLHPLFALREIWKPHDYPDGERLIIQDKVTGRAAAFLCVAIGVHEIQTALLSARSCEILDLHGILYTAETELERIACMTEDLLTDTIAIDDALAILDERRRLAALRSV